MSQFNWGEAIADSVIRAGVSFFATLGGLGATGLLSDLRTGFLAAVIAAGSTFFLTLAGKRGLQAYRRE